MNERILALAASHFPRDEEGNIHATPEIIVEFTELIVRECASIASNPAPGCHSSFGKIILEHFGIK